MSSSKSAFIFPGQGSQKVGMLSEYASSPVFMDTFTEASDAIGYDVWRLTQEGPDASLNLTENTQPALLTSSVALWRLWQEKGGKQPDFLAGHSLGEWSALVCSGVVAFNDAVKLVQLRGRYMQQAVPVGEGAMAAIIGLDDDRILSICEDMTQHGVVDAVNFNAPGQVVIAGATAAVEAASHACKEAGAKRAMPLPVSAPFHTVMMKPAAEQLSEAMQSTTFNAPSIPIVHNVTAATESSADNVKALMIEQIYSPVRWVACSQALASAGVNNAVECGPGKVLAGLMKRIDKTIAVVSLDSIASFDAATSL